MIKTVTVSLGGRSYSIHIGVGALGRFAEHVSLGGAGRMAIVTDTNVAPLYAEPLAGVIADKTEQRPAVFALPAGEEHKRLEQIEWLCGRFLESGLDRSSRIIALGGGVVGDMAGFAAAVFMRGIPCVQAPTTLLAQVDSSVGGKTGVNHPLGKNTIGAFHQPSAVVIDLDTLRTLPDRELRAGLAEVVKHGVIADADLFDYLVQEAPRMLAKDLGALTWPIVRSCEIKAAVVSADEREQGERANLNYGHTFGHAIESVTHYRRFLHGEAVALGMQAAAHLAVLAGMAPPDLPERQAACLQACGLPVTWNELPVDDTMALMRHDKKGRAGKMLFVLPERVGRVERRSDIPEELIRAALVALTGS